jgi:exodeoxyribonuclease VII large subunit
MGDIFSATAPADDAIAHNLPEYSVSEISVALKREVEGAFPRVRVRGEISQPSFPRSGHCYFRLKDDGAVLDAVCWKGGLARLEVRPEEGLEVIATGRITTYAGSSRYQIVVEALEMAGQGALLKLLEDRRKKLTAEGLFAAERKRALPYLPDVIGVVTSPSGAVIRDILHRLADRFPRHVLIWPVAVQGDKAAAEVAAAIEGFNRLTPDGVVPRPDVLIVARGGGSLEDLWAFNEEIVVRAAANSKIPLISAVGHETDTTLIDFASDRRAPTPTAAAEMAVPVRADLLAQALRSGARMIAAINRGLAQERTRLLAAVRGLPRPLELIEERGQRLDDRTERLLQAGKRLIDMRVSEVAHASAKLRSPAAQIDAKAQQLLSEARALQAGWHRYSDRVREGIANGGEKLARLRRQADAGLKALLERRDTALAGAGKLLESYSFHTVLKRGFALVRDGAGEPVLSAAAAQGDVSIEFADGKVGAAITGKPATPSPPRTPRKPSSGSGGQGSLL